MPKPTFQPRRIALAIVSLTAIAFSLPLRAVPLRSGGYRVDFVWTQIHRLWGGFSIPNMEIFFPLGGAAWLVVCIYYLIKAIRNRFEGSLLIPWILICLHLGLRGWVDVSIVPFHLRYLRTSFWAWPSYLPIIGALASLVSIVFQVEIAVNLRRRNKGTATVFRVFPRTGAAGLLAALLFGIPLALVLRFAGAFILEKLNVGPQLLLHASLEFIITLICCVMGFAIFFFQLGLRRLWPLWGLACAALAIPATIAVNYTWFEDIFEGLPLGKVWHKTGGTFLVYLLVFVGVFFAEKVYASLIRHWQKTRHFLSKQHTA